MAKTTVKEPKTEERVRILLPLLDDGTTKADQTENVTINGYTTLIERGQWVEVTQDVYIVLRSKYPNL